MGFFGFLKKKPGEGLAAPSKPGEKESVQGTPSTPASLDDVPLPGMQQPEKTSDPSIESPDPSMIDAPPQALGMPFDMSPKNDVLAENGSVSDAADEGLESAAQEAPSMLPESLMTPAPRSTMPRSRTVSVDSVQELPVTEEENLDALPVQGKTPEQEWNRPSRPTASHELPISQKDDLLEDVPDFTAEDISKAEQAQHAPEQEPEHEELKPEPVHYELPSLDDIQPPDQPMENAPDELYVPGVSYRDAISNIKKLKASAQRGEASMSKLSLSISDHAEQVSGFADALNEVQEQLLAMDNIMLEQR